ncbi:hypothetical protein ACP70R_039872 [Stipagrostis hirtigluma subsp. patula]
MEVPELGGGVVRGIRGGSDTMATAHLSKVAALLESEAPAPSLRQLVSGGGASGGWISMVCRGLTTTDLLSAYVCVRNEILVSYMLEGWGVSEYVTRHSGGIYVGDNTVIHFTRGRDQEVGTGTVIDLPLVSFGPKRSNTPCSVCTGEVTTSTTAETNGVVSSCLDCFVAGGALYRFEYAVNPALFLAKVRGGTCTLATSDPNETVVHRAKYMLTNGFRCYSLFKSNCEDFAIYCKTGLLVAERGVLGQSGQAISIIGGPLAAVVSTPFRLVTTNIGDIANRPDVVKVEVEDLAAGLASGRIRAVENLSQLVSPAQNPAATILAA